VTREDAKDGDRDGCILSCLSLVTLHSSLPRRRKGQGSNLQALIGSAAFQAAAVAGCRLAPPRYTIHQLPGQDSNLQPFA
jgi:hypothetical protein